MPGSGPDLIPEWGLMRTALHCRCPQCDQGKIFKPGLLSMTLRDKCPQCGLDLAKNDSGDGPAVFLIFILGFLLVPLAVLFEMAASPPLWAHGVIWTLVSLGLTLGTLKPLKAYVIALQFKHRPGDWR